MTWHAAVVVEDASTTNSAKSPRQAWSWWLAPDLALVVSIFTLIYVLAAFDGTRELLRDSDPGWHIRTGELILSGAGLPTTDPYSLTRAGDPWFAWEWGADVLMGFLHLNGGMAAVTGFFAVVLASCVWVWFRLNSAQGGHFLIAAAFTPLVLIMTQIHWHARPHVLSWLLLLGAVYYAEQPKRRLWVVAVAAVLWVNLHASFFFGVLIALVYAAGHLLRPLIWDGMNRSEEWAEARWFGIAGCVVAVASLCNPYGWNLHRHLFAYLTNNEMLAQIGEFKSFNFLSSQGPAVMVGLILAGVGGVLSMGQKRLPHVLLLVMLVAVALRSGRGLPVVALLCLPIANRAITESLRDAKGLQPWLRKRIDGFLSYGENLWRIDRRFAGPLTALVAAAVLVAVLRMPAVANRAGFSDTRFPVLAAAHLEQLPVMNEPENLRLLSTDFFGGYLIYRFNGKVKVFTDGRSDFYGAQFLKNYLDLTEVRAGWQDQLHKAGFNHALLPKRCSLITALEMNGWKRIFADDVAVLLQAPAQMTSVLRSR